MAEIWDGYPSLGLMTVDRVGYLPMRFVDHLTREPRHGHLVTWRCYRCYLLGKLVFHSGSTCATSAYSAVYCNICMCVTAHSVGCLSLVACQGWRLYSGFGMGWDTY